VLREEKQHNYHFWVNKTKGRGRRLYQSELRSPETLVSKGKSGKRFREKGFENRKRGTRGLRESGGEKGGKSDAKRRNSHKNKQR